jgi:hypothetical protein
MAIDAYDLGIIQNIEFTFDNNVRNAIVYFSAWNPNTQSTQNILTNNDFIKIYYKPYRFWKAYKYTSTQYNMEQIYDMDDSDEEYIDIPENPILDYGIVKMPPPIFVRKNGYLTYTKIKR